MEETFQEGGESTCPAIGELKGNATIQGSLLDVMGS
jgi:hypothetical protein